MIIWQFRPKLLVFFARRCSANGAGRRKPTRSEKQRHSPFSCLRAFCGDLCRKWICLFGCVRRIYGRDIIDSDYRRSGGIRSDGSSVRTWRQRVSFVFLNLTVSRSNVIIIRKACRETGFFYITNHGVISFFISEGRSIFLLSKRYSGSNGLSVSFSRWMKM